MKKNNNSVKQVNYPVVEKFVSINGEGRKAGQLAVFIRFKGCNLNCSYCDTKWANQKDAQYTEMTVDDIVEYIKDQRVKNVTLTGGEPLMQKNIEELLHSLSHEDLYVEIETNGSINLQKYIDVVTKNRPSFTMDYKLGLSGMEQFMCLENFRYLTKKDTVKFVSGCIADLDQVRKIIDKYNLLNKCSLFISPVFGSIDPADIVEYMKKYHMNGVNLQIQMHKVIWNPQERGV